MLAHDSYLLDLAVPVGRSASAPCASAAGYDAAIVELDVGTDCVVAFHLNDAKRGLGSRVDRHEHVGHRVLGKPAFRIGLSAIEPGGGKEKGCPILAGSVNFPRLWRLQPHTLLISPSSC